MDAEATIDNYGTTQSPGLNEVLEIDQDNLYLITAPFVGMLLVNGAACRLIRRLRGLLVVQLMGEEIGYIESQAHTSQRTRVKLFAKQTVTARRVMREVEKHIRQSLAGVHMPQRDQPKCSLNRLETLILKIHNDLLDDYTNPPREEIAARLGLNPRGQPYTRETVSRAISAIRRKGVQI